jgi:hypothetical protein
MHARTLIVSLTFVALSACATAARPPANRPSAESAATAGQSTEAASGEAVPATFDEVATNVDQAPIVCRKEAPIGSRLEQTVCRSRTEPSRTYKHW